jgi:hypothetical protein
MLKGSYLMSTGLNVPNEDQQSSEFTSTETPPDGESFPPTPEESKGFWKRFVTTFINSFEKDLVDFETQKARVRKEIASGGRKTSGRIV